MNIWVQFYDDGSTLLGKTRKALSVECDGSPVGKAFRIEATLDSDFWEEIEDSHVWLQELDNENAARAISLELYAVFRGDTSSEDRALPLQGRRIKKQVGALSSAAVTGAGLAAVHEAGELMLDTARHFAKDIPAIETLLASPDGKEIIKLVMAVGLHTVATQTDVLPKSHLVAKVAELQVTSASMQLIGPRLVKVRKLAAALAGIGENFDLGADEEPQQLAGGASQLRDLVSERSTARR
jgi:hypothetical protein